MPDHHADAADEARYWKKLALKLFDKGVGRWHNDLRFPGKAHKYLGIKKREYDALLEGQAQKLKWPEIRITDTVVSGDTGPIFSKDAVAAIRLQRTDLTAKQIEELARDDWSQHMKPKYEHCAGSGRWASPAAGLEAKLRACPVCDALIPTTVEEGLAGRVFVVFRRHSKGISCPPDLTEEQIDELDLRARYGPFEMGTDWPTTRDEG
jgi:hypothetical protein